MNWYRQNNPQRGRLVLATLLVLFVFAADFFTQGSVRSLLRAAAVQISGASSRLVSGTFSSGFFSSRRALLAENEALRNELSQLTVRLSEFEIVKSENETLRALAHVAEESPGIAAPVVSSPRSSPYGTFMVGAGIEQGVAVGSLVVAGEDGRRGFVIGRVSEVSARLSLVSQVFAPNVSTEAIIGNVPVVVLGRGGGNARAEAPRAAGVQEGEVVIAPSFRGMLIGIVGSVSEESASAFQTLYIGLPVNLATLSFVYVIPSSF